jgi:four helix bundle protein
VDQIIRASSSIGANLREAKYAQGRQDFISKLEIALKEAYETEYWLELLFEIAKLDEDTYKALKSKCGSVRRRIIASVKTVKNGKNASKED